MPPAKLSASASSSTGLPVAAAKSTTLCVVTADLPAGRARALHQRQRALTRAA